MHGFTRDGVTTQRQTPFERTLSLEALQVFFTAPLAPFTAALAAALVLLTVEIALTSLAGAGFGDLMETLVSADSLPDTSFTNWLLLREMPLMMSIGSFICGFGLTGLSIQALAMAWADGPVAVAVASLVAAVGGLLAIRVLGNLLRTLKFNTTTAVSPDEFLGGKATMTNVASTGNAGTANFVDRHGYTHELMVEPADGGVTFAEGDVVVLDARVSLCRFHARKAD